MLHTRHRRQLINKSQGLLSAYVSRPIQASAMHVLGPSGHQRRCATRPPRWLRPLEFLVIFLPTLQSYYFFDLGLAPFPAIAFILIVSLCLVKGSGISRNDLTYAIAVLVLFGASCVWGAMRNPAGMSVKNMVGTVMGPCFALGVVSYFRNRTSTLLTYLRLTLIVHVVAITIQYICYYGFGFYPDLLAPITGEPQRFVGTGLITGISRATGLFNEPAVYSLFVMALLFLLTRFRGTLSTLHIIALLTVLFNFSLLGLGLLAVFLLAYWFSSNVRIWAKVLVLALAVGVLQFALAERVIENASLRVDNIRTDPTSDGSYNARFVQTWNFASSLPAASRILGIGLGNIGEFLNYGSTYAFFLIYLGIAGTVCLLGLGAFYLRYVCGARVAMLLFITVLLAGTLMPTYVMFWLVVACTAILEREAGATQHVTCVSWMQCRV